ncbi:MAG: TetR/AcrR family transcriptional regulator [Syntrophomonas sp.]
MDIKDRIINACRELAKSRGLAGFTVDELANRAGVSKRTVYRYYRSKEEIIEAAADAFMGEVAAEADRLITVCEDPVNILNQMLGYLFAHGQFITNPASFNDLRQHYPELWKKIDKFRIERIKQIISTVGNKSNLVTDIDPRILTAVISTSVQSILNPDFILENGLNFEKTAEQLSRFLMSAVLR